jgi:hypothetical protein
MVIVASIYLTFYVKVRVRVGKNVLTPPPPKSPSNSDSDSMTLTPTPQPWFELALKIKLFRLQIYLVENSCRNISDIWSVCWPEEVSIEVSSLACRGIQILQCRLHSEDFFFSALISYKLIKCGAVPAHSEYVVGLLLHFSHFSVSNLFLVHNKLHIKCTVIIFIL